MILSIIIYAVAEDIDIGVLALPVDHIGHGGLNLGPALPSLAKHLGEGGFHGPSSLGSASYPVSIRRASVSFAKRATFDGTPFARRLSLSEIAAR